MNVVGITSLQPSQAAQVDASQMMGPSLPPAEAVAATQVGSPAAPGTGISNQTGGVGEGSGVNLAAVQKSVAKLNQTLASSNTKVEVDPRQPANDIWLNLVDKTTGEVIQRFPPEGLREFMLSQQPKGLALDTQG